MEQEKLKKINVRKVIVYVVMAIVVVIAGLVMYSEKVHKIGFIENIKHAIEEQINTSARATEASEGTIVDVTGIMPGDIGNHVCSEYYISEYDETNHWNRCKICNKEYNKVAHNLVDNGWSLGSASNCYEENVHGFSCNCGYSYNTKQGIAEHSWNYTTTDVVRKRIGRICNVCSKIEDHQCTGSDGIPFTCRTTGVCSICGYNWTYTGGHIWCANPTNGISHEELDGYIM